MLYVKAPVPPLAEPTMIPLHEPLQLGVVMAAGFMVIAGGAVRVAVAEVEHVPEVTVRVYVPAQTPEMFAVVAPLLHEYVYAAGPPVVSELTEPLHAVLHKGLVPVNEVVSAAGCVMVMHVLAVQPFPSVTVTHGLPAQSVLVVAVVAPLDHKILNGPTPLTVAVPLPLQSPKQVTFEFVTAVMVGPLALLTAADPLTVQPVVLLATT